MVDLYPASKGKKMNKKNNTTAPATSAPATSSTTATQREWDGPAHATLESVITGSTDKALGVGVMDATGKDGTTTGYLVSLARTRPNGKKVIYPLQDLIKDMPKAFAISYNAYTKLYKTRLDALHKCASLAERCKWEMLDAEKEEVATLKASGKWEIEKAAKNRKAPKTDAERNGEASKRAVTAIDSAPSPFSALLDALTRVEVIADKEALAIPLLRVLHNAATVDYSTLEKIVSGACAAILEEGEKTAAKEKAA
jgi:hypothetical protein